MKKTTLLILLIQLGCLAPTKEESNLISQLNDKYPRYKFALFKGLTDIYVKLDVKKEAVDSLKLKSVYMEVMSMNENTLGQPRTNWLYIIVYKQDNYLFTMRDYGDGVKIFQDKVF